MSNNAGAVIGAIIDRQDGDSGVKGAIGGALAESGIKKLVPILGAVAFAFAAKAAIAAVSRYLDATPAEA